MFRSATALPVALGLTILASCGDDASDSSLADDVGVERQDVDASPPTDAVFSELQAEPDTALDAADEPDVAVEPQPNAGWIGGSCEALGECEYDAAICLDEASGFAGGACSQSCDLYCPDQDGFNSVTFCVDFDQEGVCLSRCDQDLYAETGCREGYACRVLPRHGEPTVQKATCVPEDWPVPMATSACLEALDARGIGWNHWDYDAPTAEGTDLVCSIDVPIVVSSIINGVSYRYVDSQHADTMPVACELALALDDLGAVLHEYDIVEVLHVGTYNCRVIAGLGELSQHSHGLAIDFYGFVASDGRDYLVPRDWEVDVSDPVSEQGQVLYEIAHRMYDQQIFNIILTPNYNEDHADHFHVDLTEGAHFLGLGPTSRSRLVDDEWWRCPAP